MNQLNFINSQNNVSHYKKRKTVQNPKQILLSLAFLLLPIFIVISFIVCSVILSINGNNFVQIQNYRNIWYNSSNNVSDIRSENANFTGWISVEKTKFDFPIFNSNYKNCSFYIDEKCDVENGNNLILHTPKKANTDISNSTLLYKDINFFKRHPLIEVNTDYDKGYYIVFATFYSDSKNNLSDVYNFPTFNDGAFDTYITNLQKSSFLKTDFEIKNTDDFLTIILSEDEKEFVILARKVQKDEKINISNVTSK